VTARIAEAPLFAALGDPKALCVIPGCATTAQVRLPKSPAGPVTRQAATKHLRLLESAGLVSSSRRGRERIWTVRSEPLAQAGDYLTQLSRRWDAAIERLRA
jgi:DNA-binding transcriptional ArsR family regulator